MDVVEASRLHCQLPAAWTAYSGNPADRKLACSQSVKMTIHMITGIGLLLFFIIQQNTPLLGEGCCLTEDEWSTRVGRCRHAGCRFNRLTASRKRRHTLATFACGLPLNENLIRVPKSTDRMPGWMFFLNLRCTGDFFVKESLSKLIDLVLHLDKHLASMSNSLGGWLYLILFAVVFCETGLIVTPFLPGDSLLFAVGALVALPGTGLSLPLMFVLLTVAAILGDAVNYRIGRMIGPKIFRSDKSRLLNKDHLLKAQLFYERHGGMAIFLARFVPIIRTFAPFVAGAGKMNYLRFWMFNVSGAIIWVGLFLLGGYVFGNLPIVKKYFSLVMLGIIFVSVLPIAFEWWRDRKQAKKADASHSASV